MKSLLLILGITLSQLLFTSCNNDEPQMLSNEEFNSLVDNFKTPTVENTVWTYYYWYNDNVSKEGITKDLESMKQAGIGTVFIGNINWQGKDGNVPILSEEWWGAMVHAVNEAHRIGIDVGVFNSPGWSQSGGPWIKPEMAMRYLTYSETKIEGGKNVNIILERPKTEFQPTKTIAFKTSKVENIDLRNLLKGATSNIANYDARNLCDNDKTTTVKINTDKYKEVVFEFELDKEITARQFTIKQASKLKCNGKLYAIVNGKDELIKEFEFDRSLLYINGGPNVGFNVYGELALALPEIKADKFELVLSDFENFATYGGGVSEIEISEVNISESPILDHFVEKQLGKMHPTDKANWDSYLWNQQQELSDKSLAVSEVIDITSNVDENGSLNWNAPEGDWTIQYFGMTPTGSTNLPAAPRGKGLEVDKMSKKHLAVHFDNFVGELLRRIPEESKSAFKYAILDSYETGSQNWTDNYGIKFEKKYGYSPIKYLPVLSGRIVGSVDESERFLWDLRRAIADDVAYEYVAGLREISHKYGLKTWLENYGHWGFPAEFMMYGGQSDMIGGEFWNEGTLGNIECKAASSTSHAYGKGRTSAEAFTAMKYPYLRHPARLKKRGDWAFTEGINHFVFHVFIHQPYEDKFPGVDAWFSTEFNRHNTWFGQAHNYIDYIRRTQYILQQGQYVADVCYFIGENTPIMTGRPYPEMPKGYSFDYINAEVILDRLTVEDGRLTLPDGMSYKVMVLPEFSTMRPNVLAKIEELVAQGATILGSAPTKSPSLENYPKCDDQIKSLASKLWNGMYTDGKFKNNYGEGMVYDGYDLQVVLEESGTEKDIVVENSNVLWTHRSMDGMDIYFLSNQSDKAINITPSFKIQGYKPQLWDAVSGKIRYLKEFTTERKRTLVPLKMEAQQSLILVFSNNVNDRIDKALANNAPEFKVLSEINGPYKVDFVNKKLGPKEIQIFNELNDLSKSTNEQIKYYSGTILYNSKFNLEKLPENDLYISFTDVAVMAEVKINGERVGGVWDKPYRLNITDFVKEGENELEVEVVNLWQNRLIKDQTLPEEDRLTWTSEEHVFEDKEPHKSGIIGSIKIEVVSYKD